MRKPPHSIEAEQGLLGSILLDGYRVVDLAIESGIASSDFYLVPNATIYDAIMSLATNGKGIDSRTVNIKLAETNQLDNIGGSVYLEKLIDGTPTAAHCEDYINTIKIRSNMRDLIRFCQDTEIAAYEATDSVELLATAENKVLQLGHGEIRVKTKKQVATEVIADIEESMNHGFTGVKSCFHEINNKMIGYEGLVILAARPRMGKTALTMNEVDYEATNNHKPGVISLEMSTGDLLKRMACNRCDVTYPAMQQGRLNPDQHKRVIATIKELGESDFWINDESHTIESLCSCARRMKMRHDIGILWIDYLQIIQEAKKKESNRNLEVGSWTGALIKLKKQLGIPIVCLSQLSRGPEGVMGKVKARRPRLSDLRDSGAIEQDADCVMFLSEYEDDQNDEISLLEIAKQRNGPLADVLLKRQFKYMRFEGMKSKHDMMEGLPE